MPATAEISAAEFAARRERLLDHLHQGKLSGAVLFDSMYVQYFTGLSFLATERPIGVAITAGGELAAFVPGFEEDRVRAESGFERIDTYAEYPGVEHPMYALGRLLADLGINGVLGADSDGYPGILGYTGPALSAVTGSTVVPLAPCIEGMMARKSVAEIALLRESATWCNLAHRLLQRNTQPGSTETEVAFRAGMEATLTMLDTLGDRYGGQLGSTDGASAGFRGQIGARSAWAHAIAHNIVFAEGDVLVTEAHAPVWGYRAELERTMVIGPPTEEVRHLFTCMVEAQDVAFDALRPGVTCADVDRAVLRYFEDHELMPYWAQHTGHAVGLRDHEAPFLDVGDRTTIEPGMVFTVEPGVYAPGIGGFRHSDTVAVTEDGIDILTFYPRDLESLIVPV